MNEKMKPEINHRTFIEQLFKGDKGIWVIFALLVGISILEVFTASGRSIPENGDFIQPIMRHTQLLTIGFITMLVVINFPFNLFRIIGVTCLTVSIGISIYIQLFGQAINGGKRWFSVFGFQLQPSEFSKVGLIIILSGLVADGLAHPEKEKRNCLSALILITIVCMSVVLENLSTALLIGALSVTLLIITGAYMKYILQYLGIIFIVGSLLIGGLFILPKAPSGFLARANTWKARIERFVYEDKDISDPYQVDLFNENAQRNHSNVAIASAGFTGCGIGQSTERSFLSEANNDFIFSIILEETGLAGGIAIIVLYGWLFVRGLKIAYLAEKPFHKFMAVGVIIMLAYQTLINMSVAVGMLPVTGQTLPLVSKGGSSALTVCILLGILLKVSAEIQKKRDADRAADTDVSDWTGIEDHNQLLDVNLEEVGDGLD